jgi:TolB-like protein
MPARPSTEKVASIAVLPFVNRSASADDEYFSDGLADELLNVLAKIKGLRVTARTSSFHFKGKDATIAEVGKALDVATVLEGSVRKAGNRVRISVQLVSVASSSQLWSESYDRTLDDIFAVQDDIAQSVVKELRSTLLGEEADSDASERARAEVAKAAKGRGTHPEAHRLFLQARHLLDRVNREDLAKGIEYLKQALELDTEFALAWAELSRAHMVGANTGWAPSAEGHTCAKEAVTRALELEPDLACRRPCKAA